MSIVSKVTIETQTGHEMILGAKSYVDFTLTSLEGNYGNGRHIGLFFTGSPVEPVVGKRL